MRMSILGTGRKFRLNTFLAVAGLLVLALFFAGCGGSREAKPAPVQNQPPAKDAPKEAPKEAPVKIILYFSDSQAEKLVPEEREVVKGGLPLEEIIVRELIRGPEKKGLFKTIPESARLLSLSVKDGVAHVNFSREIQTKHWGGSAGEGMTVYSVVNSLTQLEGIKKVQFLVEGRKVESLLGHMDTSEPVGPNKSIIGN